MVNSEHTKALAYELAHRSLAQVIFETGLLVLIALTAIVGNACVLYVFYKTPRLRNLTSYYIITLAISDIVQVAIQMPLGIAVCASGRDVLGPRLGKGQGFVVAVLVNGTLQTLALIGINRYLCVAKQKLYKKMFTKKSTISMIIGMWVSVASTMIFFLLMGWIQLTYNPGMFSYFPKFNSKELALYLNVIHNCLNVVFPLTAVVMCYRKIHQVVKQHNANVSSTLQHGEIASTNSSVTKEEIHLTLSLAALVCGFIICWIPATVIVALSFFIDLPRAVGLISVYLICFSSAVNPITYNIFNKPFRRAFLAIFGSRVTLIRVAPVGGQNTSD